MILSARSVRRAVLPVALGLAIAACSGEQSTEPEGPTPLTAISLSVQPVACRSDLVRPATDTPGEYVFQLGNMPVVAEGRADDVYLHFGSDHCPGTFDMDIYAPEQDSWIRVESESRWIDIQCGHWGWGIFHRLMSDYGLGDFRDLLDATGHLRMRVDQIDDFYAWVVAYAREYRFVPLPPMSAMRGSAGMALSEEHLWVARPFADGTGKYIDSLFIYGLDGTREDAAFLDDLQVISMCRAPNGDVWAVAMNPSYRFVLLNRGGHVQSSFTFSEPVRSDIAWWDDRIWFITGDVMSNAIAGVDVAASVESGEAVVDRRFTVDFSDYYFHGLFIEAGSLYGIPSKVDSLWRFSFGGEVLEEWSVPVGSVECMARDSTSLWVIHHGPSQAPTNGALLTRFLFP